MDKAEIMVLIATRPKAYGWVKFQNSLLWVFFVLGILMFANTCFLVVGGIDGLLDLEELSWLLSDLFYVDHEKMKDILFKYYAIRQAKFILYSFFLSFMLIIASRYCRKIIKRNEYILKLEEVIRNS